MAGAGMEFHIFKRENQLQCFVIFFSSTILVWFHYINKSKRRINGSRFLSIGNSTVACISSLFFIVHSSVVLSVHSFIHFSSDSLGIPVLDHAALHEFQPAFNCLSLRCQPHRLKSGIR